MENNNFEELENHLKETEQRIEMIFKFFWKLIYKFFFFIAGGLEKVIEPILKQMDDKNEPF
jgi:hypothetical protein